MPDGSLKVFEPGDKLEGLDRDLVARFLERGTAATYDVTKSTGDQVQEALDEQEGLKAKIAELESKLAAATKAQEGPPQESLDAAEKLKAQAAKSTTAKS
jgi:hypothetical protein